MICCNCSCRGGDIQKRFCFFHVFNEASGGEWPLETMHFICSPAERINVLAIVAVGTSPISESANRLLIIKIAPDKALI